MAKPTLHCAQISRARGEGAAAGQGGCHHWIFGRSLGAPRTSSDLCSMRSAHIAAFPIASACARSSRAARLGRRPHAKQEHRRPAQDAQTCASSFTLIVPSTFASVPTSRPSTPRTPPRDLAVERLSPCGLGQPRASPQCTLLSPRARLIGAVQGWFRHSIGQVRVLAHS